MHGHLYVHRDLKSHNIMIRLDPRATDALDTGTPGALTESAGSKGTLDAQGTALSQGVQGSSGVRMVAKIGDLGTAVRVASKDSSTLHDVCGTSGYTGIYTDSFCALLYMHTFLHAYILIYMYSS